MFKKILVANRGEIALRIIRACKELGIHSVAIYSEPDIDSMHVHLADEAICIGPGPSIQSYLRPNRIISAAEIANVEAIHPGYGFLSEDAQFAEICQSCKIKFIGPDYRIISMMGDKNIARQTALKHGLPVTPGSKGILKNEEQALEIANKIGYPIMLKAASGGGGRGMRRVFSENELVPTYMQASREAENCFGNGNLYLEKLLINPHHIEFQIFGDSSGNFIHLGERDCSMQRRNQKIIEETPSPMLTKETRERMGKAAADFAKNIGYENCGTIEFLADELGNFYFMEMNTRIQVEHPITEEVYGCDLIKEQIQVASGLPISDYLLNAKPRHHSIECRINAEDPSNNFSPNPGKIEFFYTPGGLGVRVDSHVYSGYFVPQYYDSMIAKLIVHGANRDVAIARLKRALDEFIIRGIKTTIPFQRAIIDSADFKGGQYNTGWIEGFLKEYKKNKDAFL